MKFERKAARAERCRWAALIVALVLDAAAAPTLGLAEGRCRADEAGPAIVVAATGLEDRRGLLRLELYPAIDGDFLAGDADLVRSGKTFRRVEIAVPAEGAVQLCIRAPGPGAYALSLVHDRDRNRKFSLSEDGIGFANNPRLGLSLPRAAAAKVEVGEGITHIVIRLNYRRGLLSFGPVKG